MKLLSFILAMSCVALADSTVPPQLAGIGIDQRLGAHIPLAAQFIDQDGRTVALDSYFHKRPVVLALVYYECPMLCSQILSGVVNGLRPLSLRPGRDFEVVAISINPAETSQEAIAKRDFYSRNYSRNGDITGWHFLVGNEQAIRSVADAVGFHYRYDPKTKIFIHASGIMVLTPEGQLARYLYGVDYVPNDLKLSLIEASHNKIGSPVDQFLLFCYHYDPSTGKYSAITLKSLQVSSAATLLIVVVGLTLLWRKEIRYGRRVMREARRS